MLISGPLKNTGGPKFFVSRFCVSCYLVITAVRKLQGSGQGARP